MRMTKKILGKGNWFKGKKRDHEDQDQDDVHSLGSPKKRQKVGSHHRPGRVVGSDQKDRVIGKVDNKRRCQEDDHYHQEDNIERREYVRKQGKQKKKLPEKPIHQEPPTITVMFVDQTVGGELAKRLQAAEDRLALMTGYRVRVSETSGSQLCRILPNTNPWSGSHCGRANCYTCGQGGEKLEDCKRRNVLYELSCTLCEKEEEENDERGHRRRKVRRGMQGGAVYVGETGRSIFERSSEHVKDAQSQKEESHMVKHWLTDHPQEVNLPPFKFKVVASFQDALSRQVAESVRIDMRGGLVLNSKTEYSRCRLPRLTIDRSEWEERKLKERQEQELIMKESEVGDKASSDSLNGGAVWELGMRSVMEKRKQTTEETGRRKRRKREILVCWGGPLTAEEDGIKRWLIASDEVVDRSDKDSSMVVEHGQECDRSLRVKVAVKQPSIKQYTYTWTEMSYLMIKECLVNELVEAAWRIVEDNDEVRQVQEDGRLLLELDEPFPVP